MENNREKKANQYNKKIRTRKIKTETLALMMLPESVMSVVFPPLFPLIWKEDN
jgi:hypothetical protein